MHRFSKKQAVIICTAIGSVVRVIVSSKNIPGLISAVTDQVDAHRGVVRFLDGAARASVDGRDEFYVSAICEFANDALACRFVEIAQRGDLLATIGKMPVVTAPRLGEGYSAIADFDVDDQPGIVRDVTGVIKDSAGDIMSLHAETLPYAHNRPEGGVPGFRMRVVFVVPSHALLKTCFSDIERWARGWGNLSGGRIQLVDLSFQGTDPVADKYLNSPRAPAPVLEVKAAMKTPEIGRYLGLGRSFESRALIFEEPV